MLRFAIRIYKGALSTSYLYELLRTFVSNAGFHAAEKCKNKDKIEPYERTVFSSLSFRSVPSCHELYLTEKGNKLRGY